MGGGRGSLEMGGGGGETLKWEGGGGKPGNGRGGGEAWKWEGGGGENLENNTNFLLDVCLILPSPLCPRRLHWSTAIPAECGSETG